ncbi:MAG TPA: hypothetical protein PLH57_08245 [Oligoflexia bacterium]|nr:hypothetical protein [Oligoflexia bacterium]
MNNLVKDLTNNNKKHGLIVAAAFFTVPVSVILIVDRSGDLIKWIGWPEILASQTYEFRGYLGFLILHIALITTGVIFGRNGLRNQLRAKYKDIVQPQ